MLSVFPIRTSKARCEVDLLHGATVLSLLNGCSQGHTGQGSGEKNLLDGHFSLECQSRL